MELSKTERGFPIVRCEPYPPGCKESDCLIKASSAIGDYEDSFDKPGSSYLWVGQPMPNLSWKSA